MAEVIDIDELRRLGTTLRGIQTDLRSALSRVDGIERRFALTEERLADLEAQGRELRDEVARLDRKMDMVLAVTDQVRTELGGRMDQVEGRIERIEGRMERIEGRMDRIDSRMDQIERRMDQIEGRMDRIESRMERLEDRMERLETRMDRMEGLLVDILAELRGRRPA